LIIYIPFLIARIVDSEVDLDEEIKKLHALATAPHLYKVRRG
jgi:hypothetical protein